MSKFSVDRIARGVHYRIGRYLAKRDADAAARTALIPTRINVGCGQDKRPGYLNIDVDPASRADILIVDNDDSMIPRNYFEEVLAHDVLEHIPRAKSLSALLDWSDYLVDGGKLVLETSSILGVAEKLQQSPLYEQHHGWTTCLFGNQVHSGDYHLTGFTELTLKVHLLAAGFRIDRLGLRDDWLLTAEATKVDDWVASCDPTIKSDAEFTREAYRQALFRDVKGEELEAATRGLRMAASRKVALKAIYASPERLFRIATRNGL
ncbi:MAG: methyltransferase [Alphaproteobacteria bacterium]